MLTVITHSENPDICDIIAITTLAYHYDIMNTPYGISRVRHNKPNTIEGDENIVCIGVGNQYQPDDGMFDNHQDIKLRSSMVLVNEWVNSVSSNGRSIETIIDVYFDYYDRLGSLFASRLNILTQDTIDRVTKARLFILRLIEVWWEYMYPDGNGVVIDDSPYTIITDIIKNDPITVDMLEVIVNTFMVNYPILTIVVQRYLSKENIDIGVNPNLFSISIT